MNFVASDFDYYERTIKVMYQNYYWKRLMVSGIALVIIAYSSIFQDNLFFGISY